MRQQLTVNETDALLLPFIHAEDEHIADELLTELISNHAEPLINKIIRSKLHVSLSLAQGSNQNQDALEIAGDVRSQILSELRKLKSETRRRPIHDFAGYVALKTYSACADYFRAKNPQRRRLKDLLRHHLNHDEKFALWEAENNRWLCGFKKWNGEDNNRELIVLSDALSVIDMPIVSVTGALGLAVPDFLCQVFDQVGGPIDFDDLLLVAARAWNVNDQAVDAVIDDATTNDKTADPSASVEALFEQRTFLLRLWIEMCELPPLQRSALLLNLRDHSGANVIFFLPHLGIASRTELAAALSMDIEELAGIWGDLPMEDSAIASRLGVTRQQVINLRKTARERLTRRMKAWENRAEGNKP